MTVAQEPTWQESARQVQVVRDLSIKQVDPDIAALSETYTGRIIDVPREHLTQPEQIITETSAEALVTALAAGKLSATAVTEAFLRRAAIAQKLVGDGVISPENSFVSMFRNL
jgi:hypothetical protein